MMEPLYLQEAFYHDHLQNSGVNPAPIREDPWVEEPGLLDGGEAFGRKRRLG